MVVLVRIYIWAKNIPFLSAKLSVIGARYLPGFGQSDSTQEHTLSSILTPLLESLHQLVSNNEPINLVCFSFGGLVGSQLVIERGKVDHLAI
jgi:pimeloyl-ACP methyl ester carboxylesterase